MSSYIHLIEHWPSIQLGLKDSNLDFDLSEECLRDIVNAFNIKIQKCSAGYICFKGHQVGLGHHGKSSGNAFCRYLIGQGFISSIKLEEVMQKLNS